MDVTTRRTELIKAVLDEALLRLSGVVFPPLILKDDI